MVLERDTQESEEETKVGTTMDVSEDDGWSLSYPSSLEDTAVVSENASATNISNSNHDTNGNITSSQDGKLSTKKPQGLKIDTSEKSLKQLDSPINLVASSFNGSTSGSPPKVPVVSAPQPALITRHRNSMNLSQPSLVKSAPADPHTTKHDVESIPLSNNSSTNGISVTDLVQIQEQSPPETPNTQNNGFLNQMFSAASSLGFSRQVTPISHPEETSDENGVVTMSLGNHSRNSSVNSPNMMSYRKSKRSTKKRNTSLSSFESLRSPLVEDERPVLPSTEEKEEQITFDESLYVDEKFKNTRYRYASEARDQDFHSLFKSIPVNERLLDDFSCALSREILLQGRIYITEKNICFNSNLLGWITNLVIPFQDITGFEKTATVGLFPNGIGVSTDGQKTYYFASFISRDPTMIFLETVWRLTDEQASNISADLFLLSDRDPLISKDISLGSEEYDKAYEEALLSIDGDTPKATTVLEESDESDEVDEDNNSEDYDSDDDVDGGNDDNASVIVTQDGTTSNQTIYKLKDDSKFKYDGPYSHRPTHVDFDPALNKEIVLADETLKAPPGVVFEMLFGSNNDLTLEHLKTQNASEFSNFENYTKNADGKRQRTYNYTKGLNYSIGPKSTKCYVTDTIEELDYKKSIIVVSNVSTPDVPSGDAFSVNTRYLMTWASGNTTKLLISFWVNWTGTSWVKSMIDKSCRSGQEDATKELLPIIESYIKNNVKKSSEVVSTANLGEIQDEEKKEKRLPVTVSTHAGVAQDLRPNTSLPLFSLFNTIVVLGLTVIAVLQLLILRRLSEDHKETHEMLLLNDMNREAQGVLFKGQELVLWNWMEERTNGGIDLTRNEKVQAIKNDIDLLIQEWTTGKLDHVETKRLIKTFQKDLNKYAEKRLEAGDISNDKAKEDALKKAIEDLL